MSDNITVSVMISYYNQKEYVRDSLESAINQETSFPFEIICGDDGSSDGTYEELMKWKEKNPSLISVYRMPRKLGVKYEPIVRASNNRFNMLSHARGKYITILDGDDYYCDNNKLQKQVDILERYPECVACCHTMKYVWDDGSKPEKPLGLISTNSYIIKNYDYWAGVWLPAEAFLFRNIYKDYTKKINPNFFDDNLITAYYIKEGDIVYIPDCMAVYRQVEDSSWNSRDEIKKLYVNVVGYQEAKRILHNMGRACFYRYQSVIRLLFDNRNKNLNVKEDDNFVASDPAYIDAVNYKGASYLYKIIFIIKYFIPAHMGKFIRLKNRVSRLFWKRI